MQTIDSNLLSAIQRLEKSKHRLICESESYPNTELIVQRWMCQNSIDSTGWYVKVGELSIGEETVNIGIPFRLDLLVFPNEKKLLILRVEHPQGWSYSLDKVVDLKEGETLPILN